MITREFIRGMCSNYVNGIALCSYLLEKEDIGLVCRVEGLFNPNRLKIATMAGTYRQILFPAIRRLSCKDSYLRVVVYNTLGFYVIERMEANLSSDYPASFLIDIEIYFKGQDVWTVKP